MSDNKSLDQMSSEELYELAKLRELQEQERQRDAMRQELDALRDEKREMMARHRKELAGIDSKIRKLSGKAPARTRSKSAGNSVSDQVLNIVSTAGSISTQEIKAKLDEQGITANNLAQTLAYLKRQGKVASPARSVYTPA